MHFVEEIDVLPLIIKVPPECHSLFVELLLPLKSLNNIEMESVYASPYIFHSSGKLNMFVTI